MPHKFYHGKTGLVWNVTPRAVGVQINKRVGNRIIPKRLHVRVEHVKHSHSRKEFLERVIKNEDIKKEAKASGSQCPLSPIPPPNTHPTSHLYPLRCMRGWDMDGTSVCNCVVGYRQMRSGVASDGRQMCVAAAAMVHTMELRRRGCAVRRCGPM